MKALLLALALSVFPVTALAGDIREQIPSILQDTKSSWVKLFFINNSDVVSFDHLLSWRCGIASIEYDINDKDEFLPFTFSACPENTSALSSVYSGDTSVGFPPFSIQTITVRITYLNGSVETDRWDRQQIVTR